ncbi:MAG TPA: hypothetical protein VM844_09565, partial [Miltoncostaeaceae bacterium]|nr:hypothetical protein [Miltoncostaeaceae bacterium]
RAQAALGTPVVVRRRDAVGVVEVVAVKGDWGWGGGRRGAEGERRADALRDQIEREGEAGPPG